MSDYRCPIVELEIEPHPDADKLELAKAAGNVCVVGKGSYSSDDLAVFIPANSLLLPKMLERLDDATKNYLGGKNKNRVRAARIRGIVSEGLLYRGPELDGQPVGADLADVLGCEKYVPPIPTQMNGVVEPGPTIKYDIENIANHPGVFEDGEAVFVTEKLHGTFCCLGWHPDHGAVVSSKGYSDKGLCFIVADNPDNLYVKTWFAHETAVKSIAEEVSPSPVYVLGEVFGPKIQDLHYGFKEPQFRVFDIKIGHEFLSPAEMQKLCARFGLATVPVLYEGAWRQTVAEEHREGDTTFSGNIREGCVIRPAVERRSDKENPITGARLGRVILKSVSPSYLVRKGGTEHQ